MEMSPIYRSCSHNKISKGDLSLLCLIKTLSRFHGWIGPQEVSHSVARSAATASSIAPSTIGPHVVVAASNLVIFLNNLRYSNVAMANHGKSLINRDCHGKIIFTMGDFTDK